jgi:hypothetical protein
MGKFKEVFTGSKLCHTCHKVYVASWSGKVVTCTTCEYAIKKGKLKRDP